MQTDNCAMLQCVDRCRLQYAVSYKSFHGYPSLYSDRKKLKSIRDSSIVTNDARKFESVVLNNIVVVELVVDSLPLEINIIFEKYVYRHLVMETKIVWKYFLGLFRHSDDRDEITNVNGDCDADFMYNDVDMKDRKMEADYDDVHIN